jgi:hypothetical protein
MFSLLQSTCEHSKVTRTSVEHQVKPSQRDAIMVTALGGPKKVKVMEVMEGKDH